jgi:HAD superfamily hydrolase (TIGR01509 family)
MQISTKGFELIIFDCDGVLVDSEPIINRAHAQVLTACGYSITEEALIERFCGMSDPEMLDIIEREWGRALPASYAQRVGLMIESGFRQSLAPMDGVAELLEALRSPRCVASSSVPEQIRRKLGLTGLLTYFGDNLFSATMVARGKPAPDLFLYAAEQLGAASSRCLVIEDSAAGIDAAITAGMTAIGFSGGSHCGPAHAARLQTRGAKLVTANMRELAAAMARLGDCLPEHPDPGSRLRPCSRALKEPTQG